MLWELDLIELGWRVVIEFPYQQIVSGGSYFTFILAI